MFTFCMPRSARTIHSASFRLAASLACGAILAAAVPPSFAQEPPAPDQACAYTVFPSSRNFGAEGGSSIMGVTALPVDCAWTAETADPWITLDSGTPGQGDGFVGYTVAANTGPVRMGSITAGGQTHTVVQDSGCLISVDPPSANYPSAGIALATISITASAPDCPWNATSSEPWVRILSADSGMGNGSLDYIVDENFGDARSAVINVAGATHTVTQGLNNDFNRVRDYILGDGTLTAQEQIWADVNYDGEVDVADLVTATADIPPPDAVYWISPSSGSWHTGSNWSTNSVPTATDFVVIDTPGAPVTVTINQPVTIANLRVPPGIRLSARDNLNVVGATLTVVGIAKLGGGFSLDNALLDASGAAARVSGSGTLSLVNSGMRARAGAGIGHIGPATVTWNTVANPVLFDVAGASGAMVESWISVPALTGITFNSGGGSFLTAYALAGSFGTAGGRLNLPGLASASLGANHRFLIGIGNGGSIDFSSFAAVQRIDFDVNAGGNLTLPAMAGTLAGGTIDIEAGGNLAFPALTGFDAQNVTARGGMDAPLLATIAGSTFNVLGSASLTFDALASIAETNMTIQESGALSAPMLASYTSTTGNPLLDVSGDGEFDAPLLATLTNMRVRARNGAGVELPGVTAYAFNVVANPVIFDVSGQSTAFVQSELSLPNLASITFNSGTGSFITAYVEAGGLGVAGMEGLLDLPALQSVTLGANHRFEIGIRNGAEADLSAFAATQRINLDVDAGGSLELPALAGTRTGGNIDVEQGGTLDLPALAGFNGETATIRGTMTAPDVMSIANLTFSILGSGNVTFDSLPSITDTGMLLQDSAVFNAPALTSYTSTTGTPLLDIVAGGTFNAPLLATATNMRFRARGGGVLTLAGIVNYAWNLIANPVIFDVSGQSLALVDSMLSLPNLTGIVFNAGGGPFITAYAEAGQAGVANPEGQLNLPALQTIGLGANHRFEFGVRNGATLDVSALAATQRINLDVDAGGSLSLPAVTGTRTGGNIDIEAGGTLTLPSAVGLDGETVTVRGTMTAPSLASVANTTFNLLNAGNATFGALASIVDSGILLQDTAVFNLPALASYTSTTGSPLLDVVADADFNAPLLATATNMRFRARAGGVLTLPGIVNYAWNVIANPVIFDVSGQSLAFTDSVLSLPNLTGIVYNAGGGPFITAYAEAGGSGPANADGQLNLPALQTISVGTNHRFELGIRNGADMNLDALTATLRINLDVDAGGTLSLPGMTGVKTGGSIGVESTGSLTLANATGLSGESIAIQGTMTAPDLATIANTNVNVLAAGNLDLAGLTTITESGVTVSESGTFSPAALTSYTSTSGSPLLDVAGGGTFNAPNLATVTNMRFRARLGGVLNLPGVTSYTWNIVANPVVFDASGQSVSLTDSEIAFPNLTSITFNAGSAFITMYVSATTMANIDLSAVTSFTRGTNHTLNVTADGAGTVIDLSGLTPLPAGVTLNPTNGGSILN